MFFYMNFLSRDITLSMFHVDIFRQYDDWALELFRDSSHMRNHASFARMVDPNRYLYEHFQWWVREVANPTPQ